MSISIDMVDAVKVQFLKPIFEDDFPEKGMLAWLVDIVWESDCYKLYFDFKDFEKENDKYFKETYYPNIHNREIQVATGRKLFTAIESNCYSPKYSVYFSTSDPVRNDALFEQEIKEYLRVVESK